MARWVYAALLVLGTLVWAMGREDHKLPTADLHADAPYYYVYLPSLLHGDLDFTDEYRETKNWYRLGTTPTGKPSNVFGIGPAVLDAPVFLVGHALALLWGSREDGFSRWETWSFTWMSLPWTLGAIAAAARLVRRRIPGAGLAGPLLAALVGPVVYYAVRQPGYAHPLATFWIALLVERWDASYDAPRTLRTWLGLGGILGAAALARPQLALWIVLLGAAAIDDLRRERSARPVLRWLAGGGVAFVVFLPQLLAWKSLYGAYYTVPQGAHFMRWDAPCWSEVLFSSRNGLFPWSPGYFVLALAFLTTVRTLPRLALGLIAGFALQTLANGAVWDWWAGGSFGGRRFDSTFIVFAVGAAALIAWAVPQLARGVGPARRMRAALVLGLVTLLAAANLWMVGSFTSTSVPITGGVAASHVIETKVPSLLGKVAAWSSSLSNFLARAELALEYDVSLDAYDKVVGVYALGETYPGMNAYGDRTTATIPGGTVGAGKRLHLLVGLNRLGSIDIEPPVGGTILWNGEELVKGHAAELLRGLNELDVDAVPGTVIPPITLRARP